jgi:hypothetical protein
MIRRTLVAAAAATLLLSLAASSVLARPVHVFPTVMTGAAEVPGPGDADAIGHATIMTEPDNDRLCWVVSWNRIDTGTDGFVTASHIHGPADAENFAGVVLPLFVDASFDSTGINQGCVEGAEFGPLIDAIVANPELYYVNVHSTGEVGGPSCLGGVIRGQFGDHGP